jgi:hypothetical protein
MEDEQLAHVTVQARTLPFLVYHSNVQLKLGTFIDTLSSIA